MKKKNSKRGKGNDRRKGWVGKDEEGGKVGREGDRKESGKVGKGEK